MKHVPLMMIVVLIIVAIIAVFVVFDHSYIADSNGVATGQKIKRSFFTKTSAPAPKA